MIKRLEISYEEHQMADDMYRCKTFDQIKECELRIVKYCRNHPDKEYYEIASHFGITLNDLLTIVQDFKDYFLKYNEANNYRKADFFNSDNEVPSKSRPYIINDYSNEHKHNSDDSIRGSEPLHPTDAIMKSEAIQVSGPINKQWKVRKKNSLGIEITSMRLDIAEGPLIINKGDMVYIFGESGSGKSVFLKMLAGYDKSHENRIKIFKKLKWSSGFRNDSHEKDLKHKVAFVPQDNWLYEGLIVKDALNTYADLFPGANKEHKDSRVNNVLSKVKLCDDDPVRDKTNSRISDLSGGQKKRVSIASELLREPDILILDEPDSGLDESNRIGLYELLDDINDNGNGITIIISTHFPLSSIIKTSCKTNKVAENVRKVKIEDRKVIEVIDDSEEVNNASKKYMQTVGTFTQHSNTNYPWTHIRSRLKSCLSAITRREYLLHSENLPFLLIVCFLSMLFLSLVMAPENFLPDSNGWHSDSIPIIFAVSCAVILIGLMLSINLVCKDYRAIYRDLRNGVSIPLMIIAKILLIAYFCTVLSVVLVVPFMLNTGRLLLINFIYLYGSILAVMLVSSMVGLVVSLIVSIRCRDKPHEAPEKAAMAIPFIMLFQILFSGFVFQLEGIPLDPFALTSYSIRLIGSSIGLDFGFHSPNSWFFGVISPVYQPSQPIIYIGVLALFFAAMLVISIILLDRIDRA